MKPTATRLKKPNTVSKLVLEEVIGLTTKNGNGLASNTSSSKCAYLAGCVVVILDVNSGTQSHLIASDRLPPKPLRCVALSQDGRFVAAGEAGNQSSVLVWDSSTLSVVSKLKGHLHGVACICFSPNGKHLVSVGGYIYLWDWRSGQLITKLQATSSSSVVSSVSFSSDAKFIITAGKKHLKFWTLESSRKTQQNGVMRKTVNTASLAIHEKISNLSIQKECSFTYVVSSVWTNSSDDNRKQAGRLFSIYTLTDSGILYIIHSGLSVRKSVNLKVQKAFALSISGKLIACACNNGTVLLYTPESLEYAGSVLYSKAKKFYEEDNSNYHAIFPEQNFQQLPALPDAVACQFSTSEKLVVIYSDHSLYIWDIHDVNQATKCYVLVSHSSCIWDIKNLCCENMHDPSLACAAKGCLGGISFATCSTDGTIRLWDISLQSDFSKKDAEEINNELLGSSCLVSAGTFERDAVKVDLNRQEFRSLAVSSDGKYLAAGDCKGNLHIFNLQMPDYTCLQGAHDAEILTLSFTLSTQDIPGEIAKSSCFLASWGRDCIIHLYDVERNFDLIGSIDDHSAIVTSIKINSDSDDKFFGQPIKAIMDPSCTYVVCSFSNKSICIYDFMTGEMVAKATGHAEIVTGVIFLPDCKHIVSVDGDGCVFVWKLPTSLSSKILEKIIENSNPLPSRIPSEPPACSHISSCKEESQHCKINSMDVSSLKKESKSANGVLKSKSIHGEASSFKYSISRLPKWAQAKVAHCNDVSNTSSEAHSALSPEVQIPSDHASLSPETLNTQCPLRPSGTFNFSNTDLDNHWRNVYTNCMDALSTPEMQNVVETKFPKIPSSSTQDRAMISKDKIFFELTSLNEKMDLVLDQHISSNDNDSSRYSEEVSDRKEGQLHLDESESMSKTTLEDNLNSLSCEKDSDIFKQHLSSLSSTHKMKSRNSSIRRFSSRYTIHWDRAGDYKKLFSSPVKNRTDSKKSKEEAETDSITENRSLQLMEIEEAGNSTSDSTHELISCLTKENSIDNQLKLDRDQKEGSCIRSELQETIAACKEAFGSLDAATERALQLFTKLEKGYGEKVSRDEVQFLNNAVELLPLIVEKVNNVARLVQCRKNNNCRSS
ncbi:uncharacterized protein LOC131611903 [Vicia villosa]|uniref:uncharacterized protein LOC131611903 n=1 Tax=Vicia villosa TaxID=3911 RepID=UPI00273C3E0F|nr:uncharacterized protein LOC131611903 [Vicia villosa]